MAKRQGLPRPAKDDFLMGNEPGEPDAMDANPVSFPATNVWHRNRTAGNPRETPLTLALHEASCVYRGSRWCVGLAIPVVFNDVGMLEKPAGNRREVHQDYCANGEIRRDDPSKATVSTRPSKFL